jgi:hypothetical protein
LLSNSTPDSDLHAAGTAIDHFVVVRSLTACFCDKVVAAALRALQLYGRLYRIIHEHWFTCSSA